MSSRSFLNRAAQLGAPTAVPRRRFQVRSIYHGSWQRAWETDYAPLSQRIQLALDKKRYQDCDKNRLFLMDGMDPIHRVHFASKERTMSRTTGEDVTILIGFLRMFFSLLSTQPMPTHCIVAFDAAGSDFRETMYPGYKAHREEKPVEIEESIPLIMKALQCLGVKVVRTPGIEADDAIGTLAKRFAAEGTSVYVFSRDKDFFQILGDNITFVRGPIRQGKFLLYTADEFKEEYKIEPDNWVDVLALQGDQADNIPGVYKIGPKRALDLVSKYGHLDNIFEHASDVGSGVVRASLQEPSARDNATLSRKLIKLATDLEIPPLRFGLEEARVSSPNDFGDAFRMYIHQHVDSPFDWQLEKYLQMLD